MEPNEFCRRGQSIEALKQLPYFDEFIQLLGGHERLIFQNQGQHLFYSFCISKKIQEIIAKNKNLHEEWKSVTKEHLEQSVLSDPIVVTCLSKLLKRSRKQESFKQQKDRKTSFFRTILKHLKGRHATNSVGVPQDLLLTLQKKLSKNTISSDDITLLSSKFGSQIYQYLTSPKIYKDILFNNKSQANKAFYILHLGEIALTSTLGKLSTYSFFVREDLPNEIRRIIRTYHEDFFIKEQDKIVKNTVDSEDAELFSVLNLRKNSSINQNSLMFYPYSETYEYSSEGEKTLQKTTLSSEQKFNLFV